MLVEQTNLYARQNRTRHWQDTNASEIRAFIGVLIAAGLHSLPEIRMCWSSDPLFRIQPVADVMSRSRFMKLLGNLHVADNSQAPGRLHPDFDKLYKIRPLLTFMNDKFACSAVQSSSQSIDESMILFKGRSSIRQYMPMKPIKRGYKVWVRCDSRTGFVYQLQLYTGKEEGESSSTGLGTRVVKHLTQTLAGTFIHITFDNFFSSVELIQDLLSNNIYATGTIRSNRRQLPSLATVKEKMNKGESKWLTRDKVAYVKWMDTKPVHVVSTAFSPDTIDQARRKQKDGTTLTVNCPKPILEYSKRMGGVDRFDRNRSLYTVSRKSKKWWVRIFYFAVDTVIVNSFILYTSVHPETSMTLLEFRTSLFRSLVRGFTSRQRRSSLYGSAFSRYHLSSSARRKLPGVPDDIRLDTGGHFPEQIATFHRCQLCSTRTNNKRSRIVCTKCCVALCVSPCFAMFHKR